MEKNLSKYFSFVQKDIALLKKEVEMAEIKRKNLKREALTHLAYISPEDYKV